MMTLDAPGVSGDSIGAMEPLYLDDVWTLYFHASDDPDWTLQSYTRLSDVSSAEDFWDAQEALRAHLAENMFFLMREGIYPCWDDPSNMYGGCVSLKVTKPDAVAAWEALCASALGETLTLNSDVINGISISPKRYFSIVKVWLKEACAPEALSLPPWYSGEVLYKNHMDNIRANNEKLLLQSTTPS